MEDRGYLLAALLRRKSPPGSSLAQTLEEASQELGFSEEAASPVCMGYALLKLGTPTEEVSRLLSWRDFELLAAAILRASGYSVRENVVLTKPRAQIDVVAVGPSYVLSIDCKHYSRGNPPSSLARFARNQLRRSELLRKKKGGSRPIASVILSMSEPEGGFVEGVAVVPIRTLRDFLTGLESYGGMLALR